MVINTNIKQVGFMSDENTKRELTFGEKAMGVSFNPAGSPNVDKLKGLYAEIADVMNDIRSEATNQGNGEQARLASVAITEAQGAQMWAVKAATWGL